MWRGRLWRYAPLVVWLGFIISHTKIKEGSRKHTRFPSLSYFFQGAALDLSCRLRARNDLDDFSGDARLPDAIHVERQRLNQLARVLRRRHPSPSSARPVRRRRFRAARDKPESRSDAAAVG